MGKALWYYRGELCEIQPIVDMAHSKVIALDVTVLGETTRVPVSDDGHFDGVEYEAAH